MQRPAWKSTGLLSMVDDSKIPIKVSDRALEMVMRDVLDGMMELSLEAAYTDSCADFQIIEIAPPDSTRPVKRNGADQPSSVLACSQRRLRLLGLSPPRCIIP